MTFILAGAFLFLILTLQETHNYVSLYQRQGAQLGPEAVETRRARLHHWQVEPQRSHELEFIRSDANTTEDTTPTPISDDARNDNALIAGSRRSKWPRKKPQKIKKIASCFMCNDLLPNYNSTGILYFINGIPYETLCDDAWDSSHLTSAHMRAHLRVHCYQDPSHEIPLVELKGKVKEPIRYDRGVRKIHGNFIGGCFKRFLDVGKVYTARGCRFHVPWTSSGFASQRFRYLELLLSQEKDGCVSSPYASLTPFSRGVSLYVYYHVCVCSGKYCNTAPATAVCWQLLLLILSIYLVI